MACPEEVLDIEEGGLGEPFEQKRRHLQKPPSTEIEQLGRRQVQPAIAVVSGPS
jgi:hypothetical protein